MAIDISSPYNVGSLFRVCDAMGVSRLYFTGTSLLPPNPKIRKTSRSTENIVPFEYSDNSLTLLHQLRSDGYVILSLEHTTESEDIYQYNNNSSKLCLIVGSESSGIPENLLNTSDATLHIPMHGKNSSMNLAVATAIALSLLTH